MKLIPKMLVFLVLVLLSVPMLSGQDLSTYRDFSLGSSLSAVAERASVRLEDAHVLYQTPALIQQLSWWSAQSYQSPSQSVQDISFSFLNGKLYKIVVTYGDSATRGMTPDDMVQAISAKYGVATRPAAINSPISASASAYVQLALWENPRNSVTLSRSPLSKSFQLVMLSKQMEADADAAIAEATKQALDNAPEKEAARVQKDTDDVEAARQANLKAFHP